jgi:hypothetical protein
VAPWDQMVWRWFGVLGGTRPEERLARVSVELGKDCEKVGRAPWVAGAEASA